VPCPAPGALRLAPNASRPVPSAWRLAPCAQRLASRAQRLAPCALRPTPRVPCPAPGALRLAPCALRPTPRVPCPAPCALRLAPNASRPVPSAWRLAPRASRLAPRASRLVSSGLGVAEQLAPVGGARGAVGGALWVEQARPRAVDRVAHDHLALQHVEHLVVWVGVHGDVGVWAPMADHDAGAAAVLGLDQPLRHAVAGLHNRDVVFIDLLEWHIAGSLR